MHQPPSQSDHKSLSVETYPHAEDPFELINRDYNALRAISRDISASLNGRYCYSSEPQHAFKHFADKIQNDGNIVNMHVKILRFAHKVITGENHQAFFHKRLGKYILPSPTTVKKTTPRYDFTPKELLTALLRNLWPSTPTSNKQATTAFVKLIAALGDGVTHRLTEGNGSKNLLSYAQWVIGVMLVDQRPQKAISWLKKAANQGFAPAQNNLGFCYEKGIGVELKHKEAALWYLKAAEQNHARAQNNLGFCFQNGIGVETNPTSAFKWLEKAANQGYPPAQNNLGFYYQKGIGVNKNPEMAFQWYEKAANQGHAPAQCNLGGCYEQGIGVKSDPAKAFHWYEKAANQDLAPAQNTVGFYYQKGIGVNKNPEMAFQWYEKAVNQGHALAQYNLGFCYEKGIGVKLNHKEAALWYLKAAKQGVAPAQNNLGFCFQNGIGVETNSTSAFKWFQKAAEQNHARAQNNLGFCFQNGIGVETNSTSAFKWFQKAAEQGHALAQYTLGACYRKGYGVEQNPEMAFNWVEKAANQGFAPAQRTLSLLSKELCGRNTAASGAKEAQKQRPKIVHRKRQHCGEQKPSSASFLHPKRVKKENNVGPVAITLERLKKVADQIIKRRGRSEKGDCVQLSFDIYSFLTKGKLAPRTDLVFTQNAIQKPTVIKKEPGLFGNVMESCERKDLPLHARTSDQLFEQEHGGFKAQRIIDLASEKADFQRVKLEILEQHLKETYNTTNFLLIGIGRTGESPEKAAEEPGHLCVAIKTDQHGWQVMDIQNLRGRRKSEQKYAVCSIAAFQKRYQTNEFADQISIIPVKCIHALYDEASSSVSSTPTSRC